MIIFPEERELAEKVDLLRRLDRYRSWESLDDRRFCLGCGKIITGERIQVSGGTGAFDPVRVSCPTNGCRSIPMDWTLPKDGGPDLDRASDGIETSEEARNSVESLHPVQDVTEAEELAYNILQRAWRAFSADRGGISHRHRKA